MIDAHTVLILGAGASKPYGFPLGTELRHQILSMLSGEANPDFKTLSALGHTPVAINQFRDDLHDALHNTIDDFLSDRPTHRVIGAQAIIIALINCEKHTSLFPKRDWYPRLVQILDFRHGNQLLEGIVTLNYDRSLEHYMSNTVSVSYEGAVKKFAMERLGEFPIYHIHGMLGEYPLRPYHAKAEIEDIKKAADDLRITSDGDLDKSANYQAARKLCEQAKTVVFLGFGYHDSVISRLGLSEPLSTRKLLGTAHGLTAKRKKEVEELFKGQIVLDPTNRPVASYFEEVLMQ